MSISVSLSVIRSLLQSAAQAAVMHNAQPGSRVERGYLARVWRAVELVESGGLSPDGDSAYRVLSQSGQEAHRVELLGANHSYARAWRCDCLDHIHRQVPCVHIVAARLAHLSTRPIQALSSETSEPSLPEALPEVPTPILAPVTPVHSRARESAGPRVEPARASSRRPRAVPAPTDAPTHSDFAPVSHEETPAAVVEIAPAPVLMEGESSPAAVAPVLAANGLTSVAVAPSERLAETPAPLAVLPAASAAPVATSPREAPVQLALLPEPALVPARRADPASRLIAAADALSAAMRELYRLDASDHPALHGAEAALDQGERVARALWKVAVRLDPSLAALRAEG